MLIYQIGIWREKGATNEISQHLLSSNALKICSCSQPETPGKPCFYHAGACERGGCDRLIVLEIEVFPLLTAIYLLSQMVFPLEEGRN